MARPHTESTHKLDYHTIVAGFLEDLRDVGKAKPTTVRSQGYLLRSFFRWMEEEDHELTEVSIQTLQEFVFRPRYHRAGMAPPAASTVARETSFLRGFFLWAIEMEELQGLPQRFRQQVRRWKAGKLKEPTPRPLSDASWNALWHSRLGDEDRLWVGLAYFLGMRKVEFTMLRPDLKDGRDDLGWDFEKGIVGFERKGKWDTIHQLPFLSMVNNEFRPHLPWLAEAISDFLVLVTKTVLARQGHQFLLSKTRAQLVEAETGRMVWVPTDGTKSYYARKFHSLLEKAGVPGDTATPHSLRHSTATNLYRAGTPMLAIASLMNHRSINMTRRYADVSSEFTEYRKRHLHGDDDEMMWTMKDL